MCHFEACVTDLFIADVPVADRAFPSCYWGLVELLACYEFGVQSIKRAWFSHSFVYSPPPQGELRFAENGVDLAITLTSSSYADDNVARKVRDLFGLAIERTNYDTYPQLVSAIEAHLKRGEVVISSFDLHFQRTRREYGKVFGFHTIGIVGWNDTRGLLFVTDQFQGSIELPLQDYEASFHHARSAGRKFWLARCVRVGEPRPKNEDEVRDELRRDIAACLENLRSADPCLGLAGLKWATQDVLAAARTFDRPFALPGMWRLGKDRWCMAKAIEAWPRGIDPGVTRRLKQGLAGLFELWFQVDMTIEASLQRNDTEKTREAAEVAASTVTKESDATGMLEQIWTQL
jgi:hypothetical protein